MRYSQNGDIKMSDIAKKTYESLSKEQLERTIYLYEQQIDIMKKVLKEK